MWPTRFYPDRMFAPRFFPKVGATAVELPLIIVVKSASGDPVSKSAGTDPVTKSGGGEAWSKTGGSA
jgi:hypothetical protein